MKKIAIITTHPIQYHAPLFQLLQRRGNIAIKVFYTWERGSEVFDRGFGRQVGWDIPLLDGYEYCFVTNNGRIKKGFWDVRNPTMNKEVEQWGADAILIFGWNYLTHLKAMYYFKGRIPVLFRGDSHLLSKNSYLKAWMRKTWLTWVYKFTDYCLYVGYNNKQYYLEYGIKEKKLIFAPHAIDNDRFYDSPTHSYHLQALKLREELGYSLGSLVYMFIGKLEDTKNPYLLLNAFKRMPNENVHLLFVGNGVLEAEIKKQSRTDTRIKFLEFQNQKIMPVIYRVGDVIVLPSKGETWGLVINEAMACGKPVIVSNKVGCAVDLIRTQENGYIFKSDDLNELHRCLFSCINKHAAIEDMGAKSFEIIQNWSYTKIAENIECLLK